VRRAARELAGCARPGKLGAECQGVSVELDEIRDEQEQTADPGGKLAWAEIKVADIGDIFDGRPNRVQSFLVKPSRERCEALLG